MGAAVLLVISFPLVYTNHTFLSERAGITNLNWAPSVNASVNGFFMSFFMNADVLSMDAPKIYNEKKIDESIQNSALTVPLDAPGDTIGTGQKPDNIIFIMNESFYDLRELDDSFGDIDIMPYFDSLKNESESGFIVVPILGGGTCNTEFEVLTGFSDYFYQAGALPYQQYVHQNTVSLAAVLKADGYSAEAIHPNNPTFWNRDKVYGYFGFDTFISESGFMVEDRNRDWTTDRAVYDVILNHLTEVLLSCLHHQFITTFPIRRRERKPCTAFIRTLTTARRSITT
jgi:phosphoglycerol transferase MdoB-like AlkP superfamily enzyme